MANSTQSQNVRYRKPLTQERVRELLHYDSRTGIFTWRANRRGINGGDEAGCVVTPRSGIKYRIIGIDKQLCFAHKLAWLYSFGETPGLVDHIDRDGLNNRLENLRLGTKSANAANAKRPITNTSGFKGVSWHPQASKWRATIKVMGHRIHLGLFENAEDAHAAYVSSARKHFGQFAREG